MAQKKFKSREVVGAAWSDLNNLWRNRPRLLWQFAGLSVVVFVLSSGIAMLPLASEMNPVMLQIVLFLTTGLGIYIMAPTIVALHRFASTGGSDTRPIPKLSELAPRKYWAWAFVLAMAPTIFGIFLMFVTGVDLNAVAETGTIDGATTLPIFASIAFSLVYGYVTMRVFPLLPSAALDPTGVTFSGAFNLTKGHFWKIFVALFLVVIPFVIVFTVVGSFSMPTAAGGSSIGFGLFIGLQLIAQFLISIIAIFTSTHVFMKLLEPETTAN